MKITAMECLKCNDIIFSRTRHDYRKCTCGAVSIDGGFDYVKTSGNGKFTQMRFINVRATKKELYKDWNTQKDKFGIIKGEK